MVVSKSDNQIDTHIGERILSRRKNLRVTRKCLADAIGTSSYQVAKYERGINRIGSSRLQMIAQFLNVEIGWLFSNDSLPMAQQPTKQHDEMKEFLMSQEVRELNIAFALINNQPLRQQIAALASDLAEQH